MLDEQDKTAYSCPCNSMKKRALGRVHISLKSRANPTLLHCHTGYGGKFHRNYSTTS